MSNFDALRLAAQRVSDHYDKHPNVPIEWELPEGTLWAAQVQAQAQASGSASVDSTSGHDTCDDGAPEAAPAPTPAPTPPPAPSQPGPESLTDDELGTAIQAHNADRLADRPPDDPPEGLAFYRRSHRDSRSPLYLLLPKQRAIQLAKADADWTQRMLDEVRLRGARREAAERDAAIAAGHELPDDANRRGSGWATPASATTQATTPTRSPLNERVGDVDPRLDFADLEDPVPGADYDPVAQLPVFRYTQLKELILNARAGSPDRDGHVRLSNLFKQLKAKGPLRPIQRFASLEALDELLEASPNFAAVVRAIRNRVILSQVTGQFHIPPMLLLGPPGVGKTRFAQSLARMLATDFFRYAMDSGTTGAALLGSDAHWANTQMGTLTQVLTNGKAANPVFVLDEVDKANDSDGRYSAINALHSILEPETAGSLRDLSTRLVINASRVIWIGTANHPERIPESIHSRFKVFHIGLPTGAQTLKVAKSVVDSVLSHNGLTDFQVPGDDILRTIDQQPARAVYQAVEDAVCEAISQGRRHLVPEDFKTQRGQDLVKPGSAHANGKGRPKKRRQTLTLVRAELSEVEYDGDPTGESEDPDTDDPDSSDGTGKRWLH